MFLSSMRARVYWPNSGIATGSEAGAPERRFVIGLSANAPSKAGCKPALRSASSAPSERRFVIGLSASAPSKAGCKPALRSASSAPSERRLPVRRGIRTLPAQLGWLLLSIGALGLQLARGAEAVSAPLIYSGICDASGAVPIGTNCFAVADDEVNQIRVYRRDQGGLPVSVLDLTKFLEVDPRSPESDLEAGTRVGDRAYWISSHGRNQRGHVRLSRHRFFATAIKNEGPGGAELIPIGRPYKDLLLDLASEPKLKRLKLDEAARRMPKARGGLNIEGLCATPDGHLLLGFRNPIPHGLALVVPLLNPDELLEGRRARFGDPMQLDLGGLGIRDLALWQGKYLISAGPFDGLGHFRLYEWDGRSTRPRHLKGIHFGDLHPEAIIIYPDLGLHRVQLLSDDGTRSINGCLCKKLPEAQKRFRAVWVTPNASE